MIAEIRKTLENTYAQQPKKESKGSVKAPGSSKKQLGILEIYEITPLMHHHLTSSSYNRYNRINNQWHTPNWEGHCIGRRGIREKVHRSQGKKYVGCRGESTPVAGEKYIGRRGTATKSTKQEKSYYSDMTNKSSNRHVHLSHGLNQSFIHGYALSVNFKIKIWTSRR